MRTKFATSAGLVAGPSVRLSSFERSSGTIRVGPSAYNSRPKDVIGTADVCPDPIGFAAFEYSKYRASSAQWSNRPSNPYSATSVIGADMTVSIASPPPLSEITRSVVMNSFSCCGCGIDAVSQRRLSMAAGHGVAHDAELGVLRRVLNGRGIIDLDVAGGLTYGVRADGVAARRISSRYRRNRNRNGASTCRQQECDCLDLGSHIRSSFTR